jgi:hypothetical protein
VLFVVLLFASCNFKFPDFKLPDSGYEPWKDPFPELTREENDRRVDMGWAVLGDNAEKVKRYLEEGYDPDNCFGEEGWMAGTPLNIIARSHYTTYFRQKRGREIPDPAPDVAILRMLVAAGADINRRPYVWCRVAIHDNSSIEAILRKPTILRFGVPETTPEEAYEEAVSFVKDSNRVLEAFLEEGADPDRLGHPIPYSLESIKKNMWDEEAEAYFAKGTRPVNEAIKKGMWWESQVDLLLKYTSLDEDSLKAAEESGDPAMVEKIQRLWRKQNRSSSYPQQ